MAQIIDFEIIKNKIIKQGIRITKKVKGLLGW